MEVIDTVARLREWVDGRRADGESVGLVPTMGCLHDGHVGLLDRARGENDCVVMSVFVNPLQFRRGAYESYPRRLEDDLEIARLGGVDVVFVPSVEEVYPALGSLEEIFDLQDGSSGERDSDVFTVDCVGVDGGMEYVRVPGRLVMKMDGVDHPWHFDGVATVVRLLFEMVGPGRAYFGQKDIQQVAILEAMNRWLKMGIELVEVQVVRADDGVSLSSRLMLLDDDQRAIAAAVVGLLECFAQDTTGQRVDGLVAKLMAGVDEIQTHRNMLKIDSIDCVDPVSLERLDVMTESAVVYIAYIINGIRLAETCWCG
ncbi:MAG: pantoate--beta-alanine ligase [Phycisphaerales bacterium]|nr:pantoate--beta-alanine ligase [Phycisphaerales bacterium]